ncbi:tyrosine-type recombinase/integrase [Dechloromonas hortensis]|uniref:tyrosine-type recombinase/integrase n=1 Tax=Dechloromonas hortensis TaxID=337779 RepID=UPI000CB7A03A|nr:integrase family protein [Dechloromonas hortensis]PKO89358.1 MAG: integrase [Betaproteobacteria bacterium HGW-Betaproteobacteria-12]
MARNTERLHLTLERIRKLQPPPGNQATYAFDDDPKQLCVRTTPAGAKSFVYAGKLSGTPLRITIGSTNVWNLDDAREEARRLQTLIDKGIDPRELEREKAAAKAAEIAAKEAEQAATDGKKQYTLKALCCAYCDHLKAKGKTDSARQARSILNVHVFEAFPDIATLPASEIDSDHAATMIRKVIEQGKERTAGVLRSYLSAAFNAARKARFDAKLPSELIAYGVKDNPAEIIATIAVQRGNRTLNAEELKTYLAALSDTNLSDQALKLALFSGGQRMAQLLRAKASDYDQETQTLRLWDSKGRRTTPREHLLPLAPKAAAIVEKLIERAHSLEAARTKKEDREAVHSKLWLFSSSGKTQLVDTTPGKRAAEICKTMKGEAFDLRDIRRTCETMLAGLKINKDTRGQLLSHGLSGVQAAHYDRWEYIAEKRAALAAWEQRLDAIANGKKPSTRRK